MIELMKKLSAIPTALIMFLSHGTAAFAGTPTPAGAINAGISAPSQALTGVDIGSVPQFLVTLLLIIGIVIAVVFLIYGGIKWILSGGDSKQVESARNHIVAALIGLIIVIGAFVILNFVFQILGVGPVDLSKLRIPTLKDPNPSPL